MKNLSTQETLLTALPVILVLLALVGAIFFFPKGSILDIRGRAAPVKPAPTPVVIPRVARPTNPPTGGPEIVCSELYKPVCSTVDNETYANECEAGLANALPVRLGKCSTVTPTRLVTPVVLPNVYQQL